MDDNSWIQDKRNWFAVVCVALAAGAMLVLSETVPNRSSMTLISYIMDFLKFTFKSAYMGLGALFFFGVPYAYGMIIHNVLIEKHIGTAKYKILQALMLLIVPLIAFLYWRAYR